jgi:aspartate racemase
MKHIGIVGITALGSSLCYKLIVEKSYINKPVFPIIHPEITVNNISFDLYYKAGPSLEYGWQKVHDIILESIIKLKNAGAEFVIIPANTVHFNFSYLQENSCLKILNIVDLTLEYCLLKKVKKSLILGTSFTNNGNLYSDYLSKKGVECLYLSESLNLILQDMILNLSCCKKISINLLDELVKSVNLMDCDSVILACTELNLIADKFSNKKIIDSLDILSENALMYSLIN